MDFEDEVKQHVHLQHLRFEDRNWSMSRVWTTCEALKKILRLATNKSFVANYMDNPLEDCCHP